MTQHRIFLIQFVEADICLAFVSREENLVEKPTYEMLNYCSTLMWRVCRFWLETFMASVLSWNVDSKSKYLVIQVDLTGFLFLMLSSKILLAFRLWRLKEFL